MADERVEFYKNKIENVLADRSKINDIVDVITGVENKNESISLVCIEGIGRILSELIQSNYCPVKTKKTKFAKPAEKPEEIVEVWLTSNYDLTVKKLLVLLKSPIVKISLEALKALMKFVKAESTKNPQKFWFSNDLFLKILINLIDGSYDNSMTVKNFISYLHFNDVSYYTLRNINKVITQTEKDPMMNNHVITGGNFPRNIYELLSVVTIPEEETDLSNLYVVSMENVSEKHSVFRHSVMNLSAYKKVFTEAWMAFLGLSLDSSLYRHILLDLEHKVIPYFVDPKILMDFLVDSYNAGGVTSILALNGLFVLIHKHNLDYPDFYKKLYSLFDVEVFHMKYRARFFYLADLFLMSSHLPAYLVAAFIKRLSRLALRAPPYAIAMVIVFIGNLIRRHPNCKVLIHQKEKQVFIICTLCHLPYVQSKLIYHRSAFIMILIRLFIYCTK